MIRRLNSNDCFELFNLINELFENKRTLIQVEEIFLNEKNNCFGYFKNNVLIGFINYILVFDEAELDLVGVSKDFQSRGIGSELINEMVLRLSIEKVVNIFLEVLENNFKAINLYEKNGFVRINLRKNYYGINKNAIVMKKVLK